MVLFLATYEGYLPEGKSALENPPWGATGSWPLFTLKFIQGRKESRADWIYRNGWR